LHVKARLVATAVAVAVVANPIQLVPASTVWLAVAVAVRAVMVAAAVVAVVVVVDLAEAMAEAVAAEVVAVATVVATAAAGLSVADQKPISNSPACDRQWLGHRTSCRGCAVHGAWSPCRAFWRATF
jgi:hypothetical protein